MSSLEEINRQIEEVAKELKKVAGDIKKNDKDIEDVKTEMTKLENDSELKNKDFQHWKDEKKQLRNKEDKLRNKDDKLRYKEKQLQHKENELLTQRTILLKDQSDNLDLYDLLNLAPGSIKMYFEQKLPGITSSASAKSDIDIQLKIWPNFKEEFEAFDKKLYDISKRKNERNYTKPENLDDVVQAGSENNVRQQHVTCLNLVFRKIYPKMHFNHPDNNGDKIKSDVYWSNASPDQIYMNDFTAEIKSEKALNLPPREDFVKLYEANDERATKAIIQIHSYTTQLNKRINNDKENCYVYSILTNHEYTYCFRLDEDTLYISERIGIEKQFMGYFFILMLRYPKFTPDGFENIQVIVNSVHEEFSKISKQSETTTTTLKPTEKPTETSQVMTRNQTKKLEGNKKQSNMSTLKKMLYNVWLGESKVFYSNDNYVLATFVRGKKTYVIKCCDLENSCEDAIREIRKESEILEHLKTLGLPKTLSKIFPTVLFVGRVQIIYWMVVTEFIDGHSYDDFDQMKPSEKEACLYSLKQLHALKIRHGDVRAPNFIIKKAPRSLDPIAVIIDFGRSELNATDGSLNDEYVDLYRELKFNHNDSKGSVGSSNDSKNYSDLSSEQDISVKMEME